MVYDIFYMIKRRTNVVLLYHVSHNRNNQRIIFERPVGISRSP